MKLNYFKNLKVVTTLIFVLMFFSSNAQTTNKAIKDKDGNVSVVQQPTNLNTKNKIVTSQTSAPSNQSVYFLNEDDKYQGRTNEILNVITVDKIPADFPLYIKGKGIEWYNDQIDIYYRLNPSILKEHYRKKLGI